MESELLLWTMVAICGTVGVLRNFVEAGGRKIWTLATLAIGAGIAVAALRLPIKALQVWVAVTGATLFYDTIFKAFENFIENFARNKSS